MRKQGSNAAPAPQMRRDTMTITQALARGDQLQRQLEQTKQQAEQQVAEAQKETRAAKRHQSTAEQVGALNLRECQKARTKAAQLTVDAALARTSEMHACTAQLAAEQQLESEREAVRQQLESEREAMWQQLECVRKEAQLQAEHERAAHRHQQEAAESRMTALRKEGALKLVMADERVLAAEAESKQLRLENAALRQRVRELELQLDNAILRDDVPKFWARAVIFVMLCYVSPVSTEYALGNVELSAFIKLIHDSVS